MTKGNRAHLGIVAVICIVGLVLMLPVVVPFAKSHRDSNSGEHAIVTTDGNKKSGEAIMFPARDSTIWPATLASTQSPFNICLQDDSTRDTLQINSTTGDYKYTRCADIRMVTGTGAVTSKGCIVTLQDFGGIRKVLAKIDTCMNSGTASILISATVDILNVTITDRNIGDATCDCTPPPPPPPPPMAQDNLAVSKLSLIQDSQGIFVLLPIRVATLRAHTSITSVFHLLLDNQVIVQGTITVEGSSDQDCAHTTFSHCGDGSCADQLWDVDIGFGITFDFITVRKTLFKVRDLCERDHSTPLDVDFCACTIRFLTAIGPITPDSLPPGRTLTFLLDPDNQVPEYNESDNIVTGNTSQPRCP